MKKQEGFSILTLLLVAVVLMGAITAAISVSRSISMPSSDSAKPVASALIAQGDNLASGFQLLEARGQAPSAITFDTVVTTGLFNPLNGATSIQTPPPVAFTPVATKQFWVYKATGSPGTPVVKVKGVGVDATADYLAVALGLTQVVCQQINQQLYNSTTIPASGVAAATWVGAGVTAMGPDTTVVDMSAVAGVTGWMQGCVSTTDATVQYAYYVVLEPQ